MKLLFAAILNVLALLSFAVGFKGVTTPTPEELHRVRMDLVRKSDLVVVGTLSDIQANRFEIGFHGKDGQSQTNSYDSGLLSARAVLKGQFDPKHSIAFRSKVKMFPKAYWGNEAGKPRVWLLQERREPTAGFYIALFKSWPAEEEEQFRKALQDLEQKL